jgi:hypothetical protein
MKKQKEASRKAQQAEKRQRRQTRAGEKPDEAPGTGANADSSPSGEPQTVKLDN